MQGYVEILRLNPASIRYLCLDTLGEGVDGFFNCAGNGIARKALAASLQIVRQAASQGHIFLR